MCTHGWMSTLFTSGLRLKALAGFPTLSRSNMISFMAKSSLSWKEGKHTGVTGFQRLCGVRQPVHLLYIANHVHMGHFCYITDYVERLQMKKDMLRQDNAWIVWNLSKSTKCHLSVFNFHNGFWWNVTNIWWPTLLVILYNQSDCVSRYWNNIFFSFWPVLWLCQHHFWINWCLPFLLIAEKKHSNKS